MSELVKKLSLVASHYYSHINVRVIYSCYLATFDTSNHIY